MKKIIVAAFAAIVSLNVTADEWGINIEVDQQTRTNYRNCECYAEAICKLATSYIEADEKDKEMIAGLIHEMRKQLKKCEESNKNKSSSGVKIGVEHRF